MHVHTLFFRGVLLACAASLTLSGCSKEPSEEQKHADAILLKAKTLLARGEYGEGRQLLENALSLDQSLGRSVHAAEDLRLLGGVMGSTGAFDSAVDFYNRAIEQFRNVADQSSARDVYLDIASLYRTMGDERKAYLLYVEALRLARVFNDTSGIRNIEWAMLPTCRALGETGDEKRILVDLRRHAGAMQDLRSLGRVSIEAGRGHDVVGAYDSAFADYQRAVTFFDEARDSLQSLRALLRAGISAGAAGRVRDSFQAYGDAIRRSDRVRGAQEVRLELFCRVGNAYLRARRAGEAARFFRAALVAAINSGNKIAQGYTMLQLAHCDLETNRDAATRNYQSAADLFRSLDYAPGTGYAELCLGLASHRAGQFTEPYKHLKASVDEYATVIANREEDDLLTDCEQSFLGTSRSPALDAMVELLLQTGKLEEAFSMVERRTSEVLQNVLDAYRPAPSDEALSAALSRYFDARGNHIGAESLLFRSLSGPMPQKEQVAALLAALDTSGSRLAAAAEEVVSLNAAYESVVREGSVTYAPVQKALAPGVALLEFVPTRRSLYSFVVTSGNVSTHVAAVSSDSLGSQARRFLSLLRRRELRIDTTWTAVEHLESQIRNLSATLYGSFMRPIESSIAGLSKLIVVVTGDLPSLPVHALRRSSLPGSPYVAERHLVTYLPSVRLLFMNPPAPANVQQVIGVGHPGSTDWDVEYELRDIRAFYKDAKMFFGQQASLSTLQTEAADLLHLAADLRINERSPGQSSVTLSDGTTLTGVRRIRLGELFSIASFPTVVLSDLAPDLQSIPPPVPCIFLTNKAAAVIVNPYPVSRKVKKVFGETLYTALLQGNATPGAYWRSQLEMIKRPESSSAADWGAFFLWGK